MSLLYTLAQLNPIVGDIQGNYLKICNAYTQALGKNSDLCITPELSLIGYPPQDLVLKPKLLQEAEHYLELLVEQTKGKSCGLVIGSIKRKHNHIYNVAYLIYDGEIKQYFSKRNLPNYGVFDEKRIFTPGQEPLTCIFKNTKISLLICEDFWIEETVNLAMEDKPHLLLCINASPFELSKYSTRIKLASKHSTPVLYINQVGGQDHLVFDGGSFAINKNGKLVLQNNFFHEEITHFSFDQSTAIEFTFSDIEWSYQAAMLGLHDYVTKNNFTKVIIGLSGGIDSALVTAIAVDALGSDAVQTIMLPSKFTSQTSIDDAKQIAINLKIHHKMVPIENAVENIRILMPSINEMADQNIQSRIRGLILMTISNNTNALLITTGNKSEISVGYTTLYGDMCGAYNPIKDIYKTDIYKLCQWRNKNIPRYSKHQTSNVIPENILTKAPSAELKDDQTDQENLPPYELLDQILYKLIEQNMSKEDIVAQGFDQNIVEKIIKLLHAAEFKRQQSAPGTKISKMCFNIDRRYPITNKFLK